MFKTCLNTSTLRGYKLGLRELVEITVQAGYDAIEPWISDIETYRDGGGDLAALRSEITDLGLSVQGAIGFFEWIVDDPARRRAALERARQDMGLVSALGGTLIAAPAMGAVDTTGLDLLAAAERYADLCAIGAEFGVRPLVEVWGFSKTLNRLGEATLVAMESGRSEACVLADVYHLRKGGSPWSALKMLRGEHLPLFHVNDYPGEIAPADLADEVRVWPGDGDAPFAEILGILQDIGFAGYLSLELFNPAYWQGDPLETAKLGREKLRSVGI